MTGRGELESYTTDHHSHNFAAWAAGRAAFRGFTNGDNIGETQFTNMLLNECGLSGVNSVEGLPAPDAFDASHKEWRNKMCEGRTRMTHGRAAKVINIYLKARFICSSDTSHQKIAAIHPPIDAQLLQCLADNNFGSVGHLWQKFHNQRWTKYSSTSYEAVISQIQKSMNGYPLWKIEAFWNPSANT